MVKKLSKVLPSKSLYSMQEIRSKCIPNKMVSSMTGGREKQTGTVLRGNPTEIGGKRKRR